MDRDLIACRIRDNLLWEVAQGSIPAPTAPPPLWPRIQQLWPATDEDFVCGVYQILLDRAPDPEGNAWYLNLLRGGYTRAEMVQHVAESPEGQSRSYDLSWLPKLKKLTPQWIRSELRKIWSLPSQQFIRAVYGVILDRPADTEGVLHFLSFLADGNSRADMVRLLTTSEEYQQRGIDISWTQGIEAFSPEGASAEIQRLGGLTAPEFVQGLYPLFFDRLPSQDEINYFIARFSSGASRAEVIREFATSKEAAAREYPPSWLDYVCDLRETDSANADQAFPSVEVDPAAVANLADLDDRNAFICRVYQLALERLPTPRELKRERWRIRYIPLYRRRLVRHLRDSLEGKALRDSLQLRRMKQMFATQEDRLEQLIGRHAEEVVKTVREECRGHTEYLAKAASTRAPNVPELAALSQSVHDRQEAIRSSIERLGREVQETAQICNNLLPSFEGYSRALTQRLLGEIVNALEQLGSQVDPCLGELPVRLNDLSQLLSSVIHLQQQAVQSQHGSAVREEQLLELTRKTARRYKALRMQGEQLMQLTKEVRDSQRDLLVSQQNSVESQNALAERHAWFFREEERRWFKHDRYFDQLRRYISHLVTPPKEQFLSEPPLSEGRCRVCQGQLTYRFSRKVLNERYDAEYFECCDCQTLQVISPYWLEEAYRNEDSPGLWNPDPGRFVRNFSACCWLEALRNSGAIPPTGRILDFGGGYGLLTQMLKDARYDAWSFDPYVHQPLFSPERTIHDSAALPEQGFDVVVAFEVFEHLTNPVEVGKLLRQSITPEGFFMISTGVYDPEVHGPDWEYLSCEAGQHVTFWSRKGLRQFANDLGFRSVGYFPGSSGFCVIMSEREPDDLRELLAHAAGILRDPTSFTVLTREWELTHRGEVKVVPKPIVEPTDSNSGESPCAS